MESVPYMASFDVCSLFTNVPLSATIDICLDKLFSDTDRIQNMSRKQLEKLLSFAVKQNHFLFEDKVYDQIDGVAMGSPLGPVLANIFMSSLETTALHNFTGSLPLFYRRYVDDTFLVFENRSQMIDFFHYMNSQCHQIKFTMDEEQSGKLAFLDVLVCKDSNGSVSTSLYRKHTFSGLYLKWDSFTPKEFKRGLVNCLVHRAWKLCSSYEGFHKEMEVVKSILLDNGYPLSFVEGCINRYLCRLYSNSCNSTDLLMFGPDKKSVYIGLPYIGICSSKLKRQLERLLSNVAPWTKLSAVFTPAYQLSNLCKLKCNLPLLSYSKVVYRINCADCSEFYIGKTVRRLGQRIKEHTTCNTSALKRHSMATNHAIDFDAPKILASDNFHTRLLIKETLKIKECHANHSLNGNTGSFELRLF